MESTDSLSTAAGVSCKKVRLGQGLGARESHLRHSRAEGCFWTLHLSSGMSWYFYKDESVSKDVPRDHHNKRILTDSASHKPEAPSEPTTPTLALFHHRHTFSTSSSASQSTCISLATLRSRSLSRSSRSTWTTATTTASSSRSMSPKVLRLKISSTADIRKHLS